MHIYEQTRPAATPIPGVAHSTWAGHDEGLTQLSLWRQSVAPGGATPPHFHECDEVVLCQSGWGEVHIAGQAHRFGPDSTLVLPRGVVHQIFNTGEVPMEILGTFGASPVHTFLPGGEPLELPWRT